ncbi:MAG: hypothetical protein ACM3QS_02765 [Bacteroidota bacterium]
MNIQRVRLLSIGATDWLEAHNQITLALITLLGILATLGSVLGHPLMAKQLSSDPWMIASNLHQGQGYSACSTDYFPLCHGNPPTAMREPVPVLMFAGVMLWHADPLAGVLLEIALYVGVIYLLYFGLEKQGRAFALTAAALWALSVPVIEQIGDASGDLEAAFWLAIAMFVFQKARASRRPATWFAAGVFAGVAVLSRSAILAAVPVLVAGLLLEKAAGSLRFRLREAAWFSLAVALALAPWVLRNQVVFHEPLVGTTLTGYDLYRQNYFAASPAFQPHYVGAREAKPVFDQLIQASHLSGSENEVQVQRVYMGAAAKVIAAHPVRYVQLVLFRFLSLWFNSTVNAAYGERPNLMDAAMLIEQLFLLVAGLLGAWRGRRSLWPYAAVVLPVCGAYMLVIGQVRYLVEIMPAIAILAAAVFFPPAEPSEGSTGLKAARRA